MKNLMFIWRLLTFIVVLLPISFSEAAAADSVVRVIYLHPNDGTADLSKYDALRQYVKDVHQFFADEMERHGHGRKTFELETDTTGEIVVHRVRGRESSAYYSRFTGHKAWEEIRDHFGFDELHHIYLIAIDLPETSPPWEGKHCGEAGVIFWSNGIPQRRSYFMVTPGEEILGGFAVIPASGHCLSRTLIAHELGHAFGLAHDFREGEHSDYVMAYGSQTRLSVCAAEWLSVSRFFTKHPRVENPPGSIQMISAPVYSQEGIRFRFALADADGLHQAQLLLSEPSGERLSVCKQLVGESQTVDFTSIELTIEPFDTIMLQLIDADGNITWSTLRIDIADLLPPPKVIEIPDPNLATALREALGLDRNARITDRQLLSLSALNARNREIKDLTGLKYATRLTRLDLNNNNISDISPLASLTNLTHLYLFNNTISDISMVASLTNLTWLILGSNTISDISVVARLTNLTVLNLQNSNISDISPLASLTNLTHLYLQYNNISDIETIERLIAQGIVVYFQGNPAFESPGPKIEDGWVWLIVPATDVRSGSDAAASGRDFLSEASGGSVTEADVAVNGARVGTQVGVSVWTSAPLDATDRDNLNAIMRDYNLGTDIDSPVAYGVVSIQSETQQQTRVYIGAGPVKVWFNGTLAYKDTFQHGYAKRDYETAVPVMLMPGENLLFIAAYRPNSRNEWGAFFGFQDGTGYTVGAPAPPTGADPLDVNGDGQVTVIDLAIVALFYGTQVPDGLSLPADVNGDGKVNILDLTAVAQGIDAQGGTNALSLVEVEKALAAAAALEGIAEAPMRKGHGQVLTRDTAHRNVAEALAEAGHLGHSVSAVLKELLQLLTEMTEVPETTTLLPNYPNPFNPETWIPYHLSKDAEVIVTIHDVSGSMVRELSLGHQAAGVYESHGRAAYWDGRNQLGEPVASGVYFYTLTAGEFTATRKLLIAK